MNKEEFLEELRKDYPKATMEDLERSIDIVDNLQKWIHEQIKSHEASEVISTLMSSSVSLAFRTITDPTKAPPYCRELFEHMMAQAEKLIPSEVEKRKQWGVE